MVTLKINKDSRIIENSDAEWMKNVEKLKNITNRCITEANLPRLIDYVDITYNVAHVGRVIARDGLIFIRFRIN